MNRKAVIVVAMMLGVSAWSFAADKGSSMAHPADKQSMQDTRAMQDMMPECKGMMGDTSGMMGSGMMGRMMGGGMMGRMMGGMMPQLPPGNEKLQAQMHAEIMQKTGEIALKYANQIK